MDNTRKPLAVLYGYPEGDTRITFLGRAGLISFDLTTQDQNTILEILKFCNGLNTIEYIFQQMSSPDNLHELMQLLFSHGVVQDSRTLHLNFHHDSANPLLFSRRISPQEIQHLVGERPEIPISADDVSLLPFRSKVLHYAESRRSTRFFSGDPISFRKLSGLLRTMYSTDSRRVTPSAGQLYPLDLYVAIRSVHYDIAQGLYRYDSARKRLSRLNAVITDDTLARLLNTNQAEDAPLVIFIAANLERMAVKYANRGYRYALIEAGHIAQNAYLFCVENDIGVLEYGGFQDEIASRLLGLPYPNHAVLLTLLVGEKADYALPKQDFISLAYSLHEQLVGSDKPIESITVRPLTSGKYALPKMICGAQYRAPNRSALKMVPARDRFGFGMACSSDEAAVKAMAEAYERYASGLLRVDHVARAVDLGEEWLDPRVITPTNAQYNHRFGYESFDPEQSWQWVKGNRYVTGMPVWVPVDHSFYPIHPKQVGRALCYGSSSSGVAAHVTSQQAIVRAMLELVERDAICLTWYAKRNVTALPDEVLSPDTLLRVRHWRHEGWQVKFLNLTLDSVPVVLALIFSKQHYPSLVSGAAADGTFKKAAAKAWDEAETLMMAWRKRRLKKRLAPEQIYSPLDHGKLYFFPEHLDRLSWLFNSPTEEPSSEGTHDVLQLFDPVVVDLTPRDVVCDLVVERVITEKLLPINFGYGNEHEGHARFDTIGLKWAQEFPSFPHFFA